MHNHHLLHSLHNASTSPSDISPQVDSRLHPFIHPIPSHSPTESFVQSFTHSYHSPIHSSIYPSIHSFIHPSHTHFLHLSPHESFMSQERRSSPFNLHPLPRPFSSRIIQFPRPLPSRIIHEPKAALKFFQLASISSNFHVTNRSWVKGGAPIHSTCIHLLDLFPHESLMSRTLHSFSLRYQKNIF